MSGGKGSVAGLAWWKPARPRCGRSRGVRSDRLPGESATTYGGGLPGFVILVSVVRVGVLAARRAEHALSAAQFRLANQTALFHMTFKVGLQAYHIRPGGASQVRL